MHNPLPRLPLSFFESLPKTDLHVHLDGSLRVQTILDIARAEGIKLPAQDEPGLREAMNLGKACGSLVEYLKAFDVTVRVLQTKAALTRVAFELAEDAAREQVRYLEVRYAPNLHTHQGLSREEVMDAVLDGLHAAQKQYGVVSNLILCGLRHVSPKDSMEMAELAVAYRHRGVVALDLAGAEEGFPARDHKEAFQMVRKHNLQVTVHAGEADGASSIAQAVHECGAQRLGHGVRLFEDPALLAHVREQGIALECCPSSNVQTGAVEAFEAHPLKSYLHSGLCVTINTDNRMVTDTTVSQELFRCHHELGLPMGDIHTLLVNGFRSAFLPNDVKQTYVREVEQKLASLKSET